MNSVRESVRDKSPYKRGADDGIWMGLVLIVLFLAVTQSLHSVLASWLSWGIALGGVPGLTYFFLKRSYDKDNGLTYFSSLWMQGIAFFFCGTLLLALFVYLYMRVINPTFMITQLSEIADLYKATGTANGIQISDTIHAMIEQNLVPSAISIGIETIWVGVFTGSLLSALMALLVRARKKQLT
ncbi:MAG: DUF4199 domain-containing protein [Muribaculaceae bacterium]|nr:DUF4199 domain-containing protein [Muribaculaceae bacterium]